MRYFMNMLLITTSIITIYGTGSENSISQDNYSRYLYGLQYQTSQLYDRLTEGMPNSDSHYVKEILEKLTIEERLSFLENLESLIPFGASNHDKIRLTTDLADITLTTDLADIKSNKIRELTNYIKSLILPKMNIDKRSELIKILKKIPHDQRSSFVEKANLLIPYSQDSEGTYRLNIINVLLKIDDTDRSIFVEQTEHFVNHSITPKERSDIIISLARLNKNDRDDIVTYILSLLDKKNYNDFVLDKIQLLSILSRLSSNHRKIVHENAIQLIKNYNISKTSDRLSLIDILSKKNVNKINHLVKHALKLMQKDIDIMEFDIILDALDKVPEKEIESIVLQVFDLNPNIPGKNKIINALLKIRQDDRENVVRYTKKLIPVPMPAEYYVKILNVISEIPEHQRGTITENTLRLMKKFIDNFLFLKRPDKLKNEEYFDIHKLYNINSLRILVTLAKMDTTYRDMIVDYAIEFMNEYMNPFHGFMIINCLYEYIQQHLSIEPNLSINLITEDIKELILSAKNYLSDDMDRYDQVNYLIILSNIAKGKRHYFLQICKEYEFSIPAMVILSTVNLDNLEALLQFCQQHNTNLLEIKELVNTEDPNDWEPILTDIRTDTDAFFPPGTINDQTVHNNDLEKSVEKSVKRLLNHYHLSVDTTSFESMQNLFQLKLKKLNNLKFFTPLEFKVLNHFFYQNVFSELEKKELTLYLQVIWHALHDAFEFSKMQGIDLKHVNLDEVFTGWMKRGPMEAQLADHQHMDILELWREIEKDADGTFINKGLSCFKGILNRLIEGLDKIHPDVIIAAGKGTIKNSQVYGIRNFFDKQIIHELRHLYKNDDKFLDKMTLAELFHDMQKVRNILKAPENMSLYNGLSEDDITATFDAVLERFYLDEKSDEKFSDSEKEGILKRMGIQK